MFYTDIYKNDEKHTHREQVIRKRSKHRWSCAVAICSIRGPPIIVNSNVRLLKSDPPDISWPGPGTRRRWAGRKGRGEVPSSQLQFVFALKRNITWWDRVEDSADASCVVLHNVPAVSRIVRYRFDWSRVRASSSPGRKRVRP